MARTRLTVGRRVENSPVGIKEHLRQIDAYDSQVRARRRAQRRARWTQRRHSRGQDYKVGDIVYFRGLNDTEVTWPDWDCGGIICRGVVLSTPPIYQSPYDNDMHLGRYVVLPDDDYFGVGRQVAEFFFDDELSRKPKHVVRHPSLHNYYPGMDANFTSE